MENFCCFLSKNKYQRYLLIIFCILLIFFPKFNLNQKLNKKEETTKLFNFVVFATMKQQNKQKSNQKIEEEELIDKISKLGVEPEDNNNNNLVDDKTILNNKKIKRRQINNLKEKEEKNGKTK
uniref:Uncharacterized protein n=1 Tax=Meloidogyne enterolobii TaxID=390850 RepID=A0A6V7XZU3_MELEN|nr:unnamed protein product [Meloidogyne enterolobii]